MRIILCVFLLISTTAFANGISIMNTSIPAKHRACTTAEDCKIIGLGGCCAQDMVVNKKYAATYRTPTKTHCHSMRIQCAEMLVACEAKLCTMSAKVTRTSPKTKTAGFSFPNEDPVELRKGHLFFNYNNNCLAYEFKLVPKCRIVKGKHIATVGVTPRRPYQKCKASALNFKSLSLEEVDCSPDKIEFSVDGKTIKRPVSKKP